MTDLQGEYQMILTRCFAFVFKGANTCITIVKVSLKDG